jgi:hypothetical protein
MQLATPLGENSVRGVQLPALHSSFASTLQSWMPLLAAGGQAAAQYDVDTRAPPSVVAQQTSPPAQSDASSHDRE